MIDIVTVVFREELEILQIQAQSIEINCKHMNLGFIHVVINDDSMSSADIDPDWYGSLADRVKIIHRKQLAHTFADHGWLTQQLCKLLATAGIVESKWTMILDAKTILTQPVNISRLFDHDQRLTWGYCPVFPVFAKAQQIVSELFDIKLVDVAGPAGVPFFFENELVRHMIVEVEQKTQLPFATWFQEVGMVTEFILYSGYVQYRYGSLDYKFINNGLGYTVCNLCHSEVDSFDLKFLDMQESTNLTVSIHRDAWKKLLPEQKNLYRTLLLDKGISRAKDLI